jgi:hypothetical protein
LFSFSDWQQRNPTQPPPGDRLDAQIAELIDAVKSTQDRLAAMLRADGTLRAASIGIEQLNPEVGQALKAIAKWKDGFPDYIGQVRNVVSNAEHAEKNIALYAGDAEAAAVSAQQSLASLQRIKMLIDEAVIANTHLVDAVTNEGSEAQNWANYSEAMASNAIAAKNEALQWAEYLAGPVVDAAAAPAYINGSPFPQGLYYQPVEGGLAGLWSAKWWALYAQNLVGNVSFYYLGPAYGPPIPGAINPITGERYPDPFAPGSFYYDTSTHPPQVFFWNGSTWTAANPTLTAGYMADYVYIATAGQTVFTGADVNGFTPSFTTEGHNVNLNGVRLVGNDDYTINNANQSLVFAEAPGAGAVIQWDLLIPGDKINSAQMDAFKCEQLHPSGSTAFILSYIDPNTSQSTLCDIGNGAQLLVCLDGVIQEPGADYSAIGSTLTMAVAPGTDSRLWVVWYRPHVQVAVP